MMERAVLQDVIAGRSGPVTTRPYQRPDEVRAMAARVMSWRFGAKEGCHSCGNPSIALRCGRPVCAICRERHAERTATVLPIRGAAPDERRDGPTSDTLIAGHFIVFNAPSVNLGGFVEIIAPSAVDRSLKGKDDVRALWSHDTSIPLGRTVAQTLLLRKDKTGVYGEIEPPSWAGNYVETVARGDVTGASFGFVVLDDEFVISEEHGVLRTVYDLELHEVSPVGWPAYPSTSIGAKKPSSRAEREFDARLRLAR